MSALACCETLAIYSFILYFQEKWDSVTRRWRDYKSLVQLVKLFLIDEVHQLNDEMRGPTMEAIVSRMKTIQSSISWEKGGGRGRNKLRFIAISATMPNISDVILTVTSDVFND